MNESGRRPRGDWGPGRGLSPSSASDGFLNFTPDLEVEDDDVLMSHVPKRLASTATKLAHLSVSHLKDFPPKAALTSKSKSQPHIFDAESWAALQPPTPASLTAFAHRIGLGRILDTPEPIQQACTHPSFLFLHGKHHPNQPLPQANGNLAMLGNSLLGLFAAEYVNSTYPYLPTRVLKATVAAYVGPTTCAAIAKEIGATPLLRWNRMVRVIRLVQRRS